MISERIKNQDKNFEDDFNYLIRSMDQWMEKFFDALRENNFERAAYLMKNRRHIIKYAPVFSEKRG